MSGVEVHKNLPEGTVLRALPPRPSWLRIRLTADLVGGMASVEHVRKDGTRDRRYTGWSGDLRAAEWEVEHRGEAEDT